MTETPDTFLLTDSYFEQDDLAFGDKVAGRTAPHAVVARALALASGGEVLHVDSRAVFDEDSSTWAVYGLLAETLLHVEVRRPGDNFWTAANDVADEPTDEVRAAWLRPLSSVTALETADVNSNARVRAPGWHWSAGAVVRFADGAVLHVPAPRGPFGKAVGMHPIAAGVRRYLLGQRVDPRA